MRALFTAASGMQAQQARIETVANNLANVGTTGFKRSRAEFQDLFYDTLKAPGAQDSLGNALPTGAQVGHGVKLAAISRNHSDGERSSTNRDLDFAIEGRGFFQITRPSDGEILFTRNGSFNLDRDGNLVNSQGQLMEPSIQIPTDATKVTVLADGTVSVLQPGTTTPQNVGQIELARFANPSGLNAQGNSVFQKTESSGEPETGTPDQDGYGAVAQGFLESSNVNMAEELVRMILAQRSFEVNSRVIQAGDQMLQAVGALAR